jgi:hypothetical protein
MKTLNIDDKWSVEYDPENNDSPGRVLRHGEPHNAVTMDSNFQRAMFYRLLEIETAKQVQSENPQPATAFPVQLYTDVLEATLDDMPYRQSDMHWRDVFAQAALTASDVPQYVTEKNHRNLAKACYAIADAMLAERTRK